MNEQAFNQAYNQLRNGANGMYRHPLVRGFIYSDGVKECADEGCHWLLDILATEVTAGMFKEHDDSCMCIVHVTAKDNKASIKGEFYDGDPRPYRRDVGYTDLPDGRWMFYISYYGAERTCILPNEY